MVMMVVLKIHSLVLILLSHSCTIKSVDYFVSSGLSDEMRSDFHLMKDLATHTRVGPQERSDSLAKFMSDMKGCVFIDIKVNKAMQIDLLQNRFTGCKV